jgi:hypothetical protein
MIDYALCLAIKSSDVFQEKPRLSVFDVHEKVAEAHKYQQRSMVLHSLIGAALGVCDNPDGYYNQQCLKADKPAPSTVPTRPDYRQTKALRDYLASPSVHMCHKGAQ